LDGLFIEIVPPQSNRLKVLAALGIQFVAAGSRLVELGLKAKPRS
jgi:hypothetical protein